MRYHTFECDRCYKTFNKLETKYEELVSRVVSPDIAETFRAKTKVIELCPDCSAQFKNWMSEVLSDNDIIKEIAVIELPNPPCKNRRYYTK